MKKTTRCSLVAFAIATLIVPILAGCSDSGGRFANMPKDKQIQSIQYDINHPTPEQSAMIAKMKGSIVATQAGHAAGAKAGPPTIPTGTPAH